MLLSFLFNFESLSNKNNSDDVAHIMSLSNDGCHYNVPGGEFGACLSSTRLPPSVRTPLSPAGRSSTDSPGN